MIVDSHVHLDVRQFDEDREAVIQRARDAGVDLMVAIATATPQWESVEKTFAIVDRHDFICAGIGVHPHDARLADEPCWDRLEAHADHPRVVLWGEIGLDYYYDLSPRDVQQEVFRRQLRMARRHNLPVSVHCRDAWEDMVAILRQEYSGALRGGVFHSFTGTRDQALEGAALGFLISFSGIVTFKNADSLREAAKALPLSRILIETDCPYLAPAPHRGKRCEPAFAIDTAHALARVLGLEFEDFAQATSANARRLLGFGA